MKSSDPHDPNGIDALVHRDVDAKIVLSVSKKVVINETLIGGIQVDLNLQNNVKEYLEMIKLGRGVLMIWTEDGIVLGSSEETQFFKFDESNIKEPIFASESEDTVVRETYKYLLAFQCEDFVFSTLRPVVSNAKFYIEDELYYLEAKKSSDVGISVKVIVLYITKSDDIFSSINEGNIWVIVLSLSFVLIFSSSASCCICIILAPFFHLSKQMKKVETMDLDNIHIGCFSCFTEVRNVQKRFAVCVEKLKEYSAFLPQYVKVDLHSPPKKAGNKYQVLPHQHNSSLSRSLSSGGSSSGKASNHSSSSPSKSRSESSRSWSDVESSESAGTIAALGKRKSKFGLGLGRKMVLVVYIHILTWRDVWFRNPQNFCDKYSLFLDLISKTIKNVGSIHQFQMDRVILFYPSSSFSVAINHIKKISECKHFRKVLCCCLESSIFGVLGTKMLRANVICDGAIEKTMFILRGFLKAKSRASEACKSIILFDSSLEEELGRLGSEIYNTIIFRPYNVFSDVLCGQGDLVFVYLVSFAENSKARNDEWMYKLEQESLESQKKSLMLSFQALRANRRKVSRKHIEKWKKEVEKMTEVGGNESIEMISGEKIIKILEVLEEGEVSGFVEYLEENLRALGDRAAVDRDDSVFYSREEKMAFLGNEEDTRVENEEEERNENSNGISGIIGVNIE